MSLRRLPGVTDALCRPFVPECYGGIEEAVEPQKLIARGAFRTCCDFATSYRHWDANADTCEAWLAAHYRSEYRKLDELMPTPHWANPPTLDPMPPVAR